MKRIRIGIVIVAVLFSAIVLHLRDELKYFGSFNHYYWDNYDFHMDTFYYVNYTNENTAHEEGFSISPIYAHEIVGSYLRQNSLYTSNTTSYVYGHDDIYHVLITPFTKLYPCAFFAKIFGYKVDGKTGRVFDKKTKQWQGVGFIPKMQDDLKKNAPLGCSKQEVLLNYGRPLDSRTTGNDSLLIYNCIDEMLFYSFKSNKLVYVYQLAHM